MESYKFYKIRHGITGLYSRGGTYPTWSKKGKMWRGIGPLKLHLKLIEYYYNRGVKSAAQSVIDDRKHWEIVEYSLSESDSQPLSEFIGGNNR